MAVARAVVMVVQTVAYSVVMMAGLMAAVRDVNWVVL